MESLVSDAHLVDEADQQRKRFVVGSSVFRLAEHRDEVVHEVEAFDRDDRTRQGEAQSQVLDDEIKVGDESLSHLVFGDVACFAGGGRIFCALVHHRQARQEVSLGGMVRAEELTVQRSGDLRCHLAGEPFDLVVSRHPFDHPSHRTCLLLVTHELLIRVRTAEGRFPSAGSGRDVRSRRHGATRRGCRSQAADRLPRSRLPES